MASARKTDVPDTEFTIEVATGDEVYNEGTFIKKGKRCKKNPGHEDFIPFDELTVDHLPSDYRTVEMLNKLKSWGKCVVRLVITYDDGSKRSGTGFVIKWMDEYRIQTNNHVIENQRDAENCEIEFNYDSDDRSKVVYSKTTDFFDTDPYRDKTSITFSPVPEFIISLDIFEYGLNFPLYDVKYKNANKTSDVNVAIAFSHPLDNDIVCLLLPLDPNNPDIEEINNIRFIDGTKSQAVSKYITFYPVRRHIILPSFWKHPRIELEGDSKLLQGEIFSIDNEIILKLSEHVTREQARNCWIHFPGNNLSVGCGLYFAIPYLREKFLNSFTGVDQQLYTNMYPVMHMVEVKPIPAKFRQWNIDDKQIEASGVNKTDMVVIGHPHGGSKMITFGQDLGRSVQRVNGKDVDCIMYSCKTCPGSSGSPVIRLYDLLNIIDLRSMDPHFMGRVENNENVNFAHTYLML